jgi:DNA polymerase III sliding clamp (beta) subunit (PCNA family)
MAFGKEIKIEFIRGERTQNIWSEGTKINGCKISFNIGTGKYSFLAPKNCAYFNELAKVLNITLLIDEVEIKPIKSYLICGNVSDAIKKAAKFVTTDAHDKLCRPVFTKIALIATNGVLNVVATDANKLYESSNFGFAETENIELLIDTANVSKLNAKDSTMLIELFDDYVLLNKVKFQLGKELKFPDYKAVIPDNKGTMIFDRAELLKATKTANLSANKTTNCVEYYLNGKIELTAKDEYFNNEGKLSMPYKSKNFEDMRIGFNGKFMATCLSAFTDKELQFISGGSPVSGAMLTNGKETTLIMPIMLKENY